MDFFNTEGKVMTKFDQIRLILKNVGIEDSKIEETISKIAVLFQESIKATKHEVPSAIVAFPGAGGDITPTRQFAGDPIYNRAKFTLDEDGNITGSD